MQLFMHNIAFSANLENLQLAIAHTLHSPPFPTEPPINFHVELFRRPGTRGNAHNGKGRLTLPTTQIGERFLALYGSGISVEGRVVKFAPERGRVNMQLVESVRTTPWIDPISLREQREQQAQLSAAIELLNFSFGRFCRDGVFSPEITYHGTVACDVDGRRIELTMKAQAPRQDTNQDDSAHDDIFSFANIIRSFNPDYFKDVASAHYLSGRIISIATSSLEHRVFLQSDLPPTFQHRRNHHLDLLFNDRDSVPERASSLKESDFNVTSRSSQGLCLLFQSRHELETFLTRCKALYLPRPSHREIRVTERSIYSAAKLEALQTLLRSLDDFGLAFEIDKAVWDGILEPEEVVSLEDSLRELRAKTHDSETSKIFQYFVARLGVPGLDLSKVVKKTPNRRHRGSAKKPREVESSPMDLRAKLAEAIQAYVHELRLPKRRYAPSTAIYQSYHLILTPSTQVLEGPLPDQSNSVLRRFGNHECFLRVSFQDENRSPPRRDPGLYINGLLEARYKVSLKSGLTVAGRSYEFLGYSMSGLKEYSFIFVCPFEFEGAFLNAESIRSRLGNFSRISRIPALLAARWSQAFSASDPSVTLEAHQIHLADDIISSAGSVFTDGCSSVSVPLVRKVWKLLRASQRLPAPPSALHFRCGGAKGVLVQNPQLHGETLCFRPSQTKFEAPNLRTLDIAATSSRPILTYLNRPLIALLEYHGTPPEAFMVLQELAIKEVQSIKDSLLQASKIYSQHGLGASFRLPSLFNNLFYQLKFEIGDWSDPDAFCHQLIKTSLAYATTHVLREIKHRAHILIPGSYTLIGVSDEWGCLEDGEIFATVVDDRAGVNLAITGRILITRSPQIHPGDVQFVQAVRRPQLEHLRNVVVFSCKGSRSLPSKLGGGDLDGDIYNLLLDENLFPPKDSTAIPGKYVALPPRETPHPCTVSDVADFVVDFIRGDLLGYISILHLRIADLAADGPGSENCVKLAEHASHAVDFNKRGVPVDFKDLPRPPEGPRPDFLSGEGVNPVGNSAYYLSEKILGQLYRSVPIPDYADASEMEVQRTDGAKIRSALASLGLRRLGLPSMDTPPDEDLLEEMRNILGEYSDQLLVIAKTHTISKWANACLSEAELVSGTIQERYFNHRKRREAMSAMNLQTGELAKAIRHEFQPNNTQAGAGDEEDDEDDDEWDDGEDIAGDEEKRREKFERAWAAWLVAEEALDDDGSSYGPSSFGLLALGTILEVLKEAKNAT